MAIVQIPSHTIDQAAQVAGCSSDTVRRAIQSGTLPATKNGGERGDAWSITDSHLQEWMQARAGKGCGRKVWTPTYLWPSVVLPKGGHATDCQRGVVARFTHAAVTHMAFECPKPPPATGSLISFRMLVFKVGSTFTNGGETSLYKEAAFEAAKVSREPGTPQPLKISPSQLREITLLVPEGVEMPPTGSEVAVNFMEVELRFVACPRPQHSPRHIGGVVQQGELLDQETALRPLAAFIVGALHMSTVAPLATARDEELRKMIKQGWDDYAFFGDVVDLVMRELEIPKHEASIILGRVHEQRPGYPDPRVDNLSDPQ